MKHIAIENLHIYYFEIRDARFAITVYQDSPSVINLSTRFRIETRAIEKNTERLSPWDIVCRTYERLVMIDGFDLSSYIAVSRKV